MARVQLAREAEGHTLDTTALVHEAYVRLADQTGAIWPDRSHFLAFASRVMRHVLIDHARRRNRQKRGGDVDHVPLEEAHVAAPDSTADLLVLDEALMDLSRKHERMGRVVECRLFGGMAAGEVAQALGVSMSTVERDWRSAKAYLYRALAPGEGGSEGGDEGGGSAGEGITL